MNIYQRLLPPPFAWVSIPAGRIKLISDVFGEGYLQPPPEAAGIKRLAYFSHLSASVDVKAFSTAKYPITNVQFARFMDEGGYENQDYWTAIGWLAKTKHNWHEPRYWRDITPNQADHPVVGVSWCEAIAFCRWLSVRAGEMITLPAEAQWQRAAQGNDEREYPWGNEWDKNRCNHSVIWHKSGGTTPVYQYEGIADSPYGVVDMCGNVWEWCLTEYDTGQDSLEGDEKRIMRGGSWKTRTEQLLRVTNRLWNFPDRDNASWGFRPVLIYSNS